MTSPKKMIDFHPPLSLFSHARRRTGTLPNRNIISVGNILLEFCVTAGSLGGFLADRSYDELENITPQRLGSDNLRR